MAMLQSKANLGEVVEYLIFCEILEDACLLLVLMFVFDLSLHITIISVVHHNAQLAFLSLVDLTETNDIWVAENLQDFRLPQCLFALLVRHLLNINLLDDGVLSVRLAFNQIGCTE